MFPMRERSVERGFFRCLEVTKIDVFDRKSDPQLIVDERFVDLKIRSKENSETEKGSEDGRNRKTSCRTDAKAFARDNFPGIKKEDKTRTEPYSMTENQVLQTWMVKEHRKESSLARK